MKENIFRYEWNLKCGGMEVADDGDYVKYDDYLDAAAEIARLNQALSDIANPFDLWKRELKEGDRLNGAMCVHMANDPETYKRMAREALYT